MKLIIGDALWKALNSMRSEYKVMTPIMPVTGQVHQEHILANDDVERIEDGFAAHVIMAGLEKIEEEILRRYLMKYRAENKSALLMQYLRQEEQRKKEAIEAVPEALQDDGVLEGKKSAVA